MSQPLQTSSPRIRIGRVRKPHGVRGALLLDCPGEALHHPPEHLYFLNTSSEAEPAKLPLRSARKTAKGWLVELEGVGRLEDAESFRNCSVEIEAAALPPQPEGEYYVSEIVGAAVWDEPSKTCLGEIEGVETVPGSWDRWWVRNGEAEWALIPSERYLERVDRDKKQIWVRNVEELQL